MLVFIVFCSDLLCRKVNIIRAEGFSDVPDQKGINVVSFNGQMTYQPPSSKQEVGRVKEQEGINIRNKVFILHGQAAVEWSLSAGSPLCAMLMYDLWTHKNHRIKGCINCSAEGLGMRLIKPPLCMHMHSYIAFHTPIQILPPPSLIPKKRVRLWTVQLPLIKIHLNLYLQWRPLIQSQVGISEYSWLLFMWGDVLHIRK